MSHGKQKQVIKGRDGLGTHSISLGLKLSKPAQNRYNVVIESYIFMHRIMFVVI